MSSQMTCFFKSNKENSAFVPEIYVYTDGACSNNGKPNAKAGAGVFFGEGDSRNLSKRVMGRQTNNVAELSAIIMAYHILENEIEAGKNILICSDSNIAIGWCTTTGRKYANNNWKKKGKNTEKKIPNVELIQEAYELFNKKSNIQFLKVAAHTGGSDKHSVGNDGADKLANQAIGVFECPYNTKKIYLDVPYEKKDPIKQLGARWDKNKKKWYIMSNLSEEKREAIENILKCPAQFERIYLDVPYAKKDPVKKLGARWDKNKKKWYVMSNISQEKREAIDDILN